MRRRTIGIVGTLLALSLGLWLGRTHLLAWYYVHRLAVADLNHRAIWIERATTLDQAALPRLMACLASEDAQACENATAALQVLACRWGLGDPRTITMSNSIGDLFSSFSPQGQRCTLGMERDWFGARDNRVDPPPIISQNIARQVVHASRQADPGGRR